MHLTRYLLAAALVTASLSGAQGRPVSYPGGVTFMTMNDANKYSTHLHYSPTARESIGYKAEYWRDDDWQFHGLQYNRLLKRWNERSSQANLYFKGAVGMAQSDMGPFDNETDLAGFAGISADWETRRWFVMYENRYTEAGDIADFYMQSARVGVAPYIGDYGDLHTWLMLEVEHQPESQHDITVMPMVRFFYDVHLLETGVSNRGDAMLNYVIRF